MAQAMQASFDKALEVVLELSPDDQLRLVQRVMTILDEKQESTEANPVVDDFPYTDEEIQELLKGNPKTGAEIATSDAVGSWADMGIEDSEAWLAEVRRKRRAKLQW